MPKTQTKPTQKTPPVVTPAPDQIPATAAAPERKITPFQELCCDLFGSFLFENAAPELAPDMVRLLAAMQYNREFPGPNHLQGTTGRENAADWSKRVESEWYAKFLRGIPEAPAAAKEPRPKNASQQVRRLFREELRDKFDEFMTGATPEETYFLLEVFRNREGNCQFGTGDQVEDVVIANAFEVTLTNRLGKVYLRVPEDAVEAIERLINFQDKDAA